MVQESKGYENPATPHTVHQGIIGPLSTKPEAAISRRQLLHDYLHTLSKTSFSPVSSKQKVPPDDVPVEEDQISGSPGMSAVREERRQAKDGAARKRSSLQSQNVSSDLKNDNQPSTYRPGQETQKTVAATIPAATPTGIIGPLSNKPEASTNRKPLHQEKPLTIRSIMNFLDFDHIEEDVDAIRFEEEQMPLESTRISAFPEYKSLGKDGPAGERSSLLPQKELYDLRRDDQHSTPSLGRNTKKNLESVVPTMSVTSPTGKPGAPSSELKAVPSTSKRKPQFKDSLILPSKQSVEQNISTEKTKTMLHGPEKDMLSGSSKVDTPFAVKKGVLELLNTLSSTSNRQLSRDRSPLQQSKLSVSQVSRKEKVTAVAQVQEEKRPPGMSAIPGERAQGKGGTARKQSSVVPVKRGSMFHATRGSLFSQKSATAGKRSSIAPQKIGTARERNSLFIPKSGTASKRSSIFIPKSGTSSKSSSIFIPKSGTSSKRSSIFTPKSGTASKRSSLLPQQSVIASERSSLFSQLNGTARERSFLVTHKSVTGRERSSLSQRGIGLDYYKPLEPVLEVDVVPADTPTGVFSLVQNGSESDKPLTPQPTENGSKKSSDEEDEVVLYVEKHDILPSSLEISDIPDTDPKRSHRISLDDSSLPLYESLEIRNERNFHIFGGQFHDTVESAIPTVSEPAPTGTPSLNVNTCGS